MLNRIFKKNSFKTIKSYKISQFYPNTYSFFLISPLSQAIFTNKPYLNSVNQFQFSKVSHLINPFNKKHVSDKPYISD